MHKLKRLLTTLTRRAVLGSLFKGVLIVGLGMLLMTSIYVLDRCGFMEHWNPNNGSCIQTARAVQRGAVAGASEFFHRGPPTTFSEHLAQIRTQTVLLPAAVLDFVGDFLANAKDLVDEGREGVLHWSRSQIDHWLSKF
jgi:hypothetical protein